MKIFGICIVKNEEDIIEYTLKKHCDWADKIFIYDNGSTDKTWQIVNNLAKSSNKIIPFKSEAKPFRDGLRSEVYNAYKHLASEGDWWCVRCDSDEVYIDSPRDVLPKISRFHHVVTSLHYEYQITTEDLDDINFDAPIDEIIPQIKYYHPKVTSETRFVRHRKRLQWYPQHGFFKRMGIISPIKIRLKHYQYRSPKQIENRIDIRKQARVDGHPFFKKDAVSNWTEIMKSRKELIKETDTMPIGWLQDFNKTHWYLMYYRYIMHTLGLYP